MPAASVAIALGVGLVGATAASGAMGASASKNAAGAQSDAATYAADIQYKMFKESQHLQEPFRQGGLWALEQLIGAEDGEGYWEYADGTRAPAPLEPLGPLSPNATQEEKEKYLKAKANQKIRGQMEQPTWVEPTTASEGLLAAGAPELDFDSFSESPWYTLQRDEGIRALESSAAGRGMLQSGNTGKALINYGSDYAYGKALDVHQTETNDWINTQLNPLLAVLGAGQVASGQMSNNAMQTGANLGQTALYGGEAKASGYLGQASAWQNALGGFSDLAGLGLSLYGGGGGLSNATKYGTVGMYGP